MSAKTHLAKWGTSLGIRIPRPVLDAVNLREGDPVDIEVQDRKILIRPAPVRPTLAELVRGVTKSNRHSETRWGPPKGNEVW